MIPQVAHLCTGRMVLNKLLRAEMPSCTAIARSEDARDCQLLLNHRRLIICAVRK
jgi:hypothetical protein